MNPIYLEDKEIPWEASDQKVTALSGESAGGQRNGNLVDEIRPTAMDKSTRLIKLFPLRRCQQ